MAFVDLPAGSGFHSRKEPFATECLNPYVLRNDFPILSSSVHGKKLVYLDNAATSQKPRIVIDSLNRFYRETNANVHRGVHYLSEKATFAYESARQKVQRFLNASSEREIIFVRGATEGINLVAQSFGRDRIGENDEIIVSQLEHHSNIVPWQLLARQTGARLRVIPMNRQGELQLDGFESLLNSRTKIVAVTQVSNALGSITPVKEIIRLSHERGVPVLLDGAQAAPHMPVDLQELDCDFYVASGHKLFGPTGIGILYGKAELLEEMAPYQGGGEMIRRVSFEETTFLDIPHKFEAGTPDIAGAIGLGNALDYLTTLGMQRIAEYENQLLLYAEQAISQVSGVQIVGTASEKAGIISFVMDSAHPHDIATILDREGIAVRAGHHCSMPVMTFLGLPATTRMSLAFYNTREEIDTLIEGINKVKKVFE